MSHPVLAWAALAAAVFLARGLFAFVVARYMQAVGGGAAKLAAAWDAVVEAISWYSILVIVHDKWLILPALAGSAAGTYFAVKSHTSAGDDNTT